MDDFDGFILFIVGSVLAVALFVGVITAVKKSFGSGPKKDPISKIDLQQEQRRRTQDIAEQQKRMMQNYKDRIRDGQRKF